MTKEAPRGRLLGPLHAVVKFGLFVLFEGHGSGPGDDQLLQANAGSLPKARSGHSTQRRQAGAEHLNAEQHGDPV